MRKLSHLSPRAAWVFVILPLALAACGGGGGGGSSAPALPTFTRTLIGGRTATPLPAGSRPPGTETAVPTATTTPTITGTATPTAIRAGGDLADVVANANDGDTIIVSGGAYAPFELVDVNKHVTLQVDVTGLDSGGVREPALINARGVAFGIHLLRVSGITLDGFAVTQGNIAGIIIDDSNEVIIRNCEVSGSLGDGIQVNSSNSVSLFNNLLHGNAVAGIAGIGVGLFQVVNNTIYGNVEGLYLGNSVTPSANIYVRNNLIDGNSRFGFDIHSTTTGVDSDFNLNNDVYSDTQYRGANDISANPIFANPSADDFHVLQPSQTCSGGSPAVDAGDPTIGSTVGSALVTSLEMRTVQIDGVVDCVGSGCCPVGCGATDPCVRQGEIDIGYHYVAPESFNTRTPTQAPTHTPKLRPSGTSGARLTPTPTGSRPPTAPPALTSTPTIAQGGGRPTRTPAPTKTPRA